MKTSATSIRALVAGISMHAVWLMSSLAASMACADRPSERTARSDEGASGDGSSRSSVAGTSWRLVVIRGSDDTTLTPDDRAKYTLSFGADGVVSARIDCNRGRGAWTSAGPHQIRFGPLALTRAMCPPGSLHDRIVRDWEFVRSYTLRNGHLFLALMADGGIYELEPTDAPGTPPPQSKE